MFQFLLNYPMGHYVRSLFTPKKRGPDTAYYFTPEKSMVYVQGARPDICQFWHGNLREYLGSPSLDVISRIETIPTNPNTPSGFRKEISLPLKIQNDNNAHLILEDKDIYFNMQNPEGHATIGALKKALMEDPSEVIRLWSSFQSKGDCLWEVLDLNLQILPDKAKTPPHVFFVGLAEDKIKSICQWANSYNNNILNIFPASLLVAKYALYEEANTTVLEDNQSGTFFLIYSGENENYVTLFVHGEVKTFNLQRSQSAINSNETLEEMEELLTENDLTKKTTVKVWGVREDDYLFRALETKGWENVRKYNAATLMSETPISPLLPKPADPITQSEAWLLRFALQ